MFGRLISVPILAFAFMVLSGASGAQQQEPQQQKLIDHREEMRLFVQRISRYARRQKRGFVVITQNGLDLLNKVDEIDTTQTSPARTYMRSIDGVLATPVYFGGLDLDVAVETEETDRVLKLADMAKKNGLKVLVMDYGEKPKTIDTVYRNARKKGYASFVANAYGPDIADLPRYPKRPANENSNSVMSLAKVKNFVYLRDSQGFGRQDEFAMKMHDTNHDMLIVDVYHGRTPLRPNAVETLKYKKLGSKRLVLAYVNIGTVASYHYYWQTGWGEGTPPWISSPTPGDPDTFYAKYWDPGWQDIITGNPNSFVYGLIRQGFDGIVLDGLETYRFFEGE